MSSGLSKCEDWKDDDFEDLDPERSGGENLAQLSQSSFHNEGYVGQRLMIAEMLPQMAKVQYKLVVGKKGVW